MSTAGLVTIAREYLARTGWDFSGPPTSPISAELVLRPASPEVHGPVKEEWLLRVNTDT